MLSLLLACLAPLAPQDLDPSRPALTVNGVAISYREYVRALERQRISLGGSTTTAQRMTIDQLVGQQVVLAEAARRGLLPSADEVERYLDATRRLFEARNPSQRYTDSLTEQGLTEADIRAELRSQLAEAQLYASFLKIQASEVKELYQKTRPSLGAPARTLVKLIAVLPGSAEHERARKLLAAKTPFDEVARRVNPPAIRARGGERTVTDAEWPVALRSKGVNGAPGTVIGPTVATFGKEKAVAWFRIERRLPEVFLSYHDAYPLLLRQLTQLRALEARAENQPDGLLQLKLGAQVEAAAEVKSIWEGIVRQARDAGVEAPKR